MCSDVLYNFCLKHFSLQEELSKILSRMYIRIHVKHPLLLSHFNETFSREIFENIKMSNFMKFRSLEPRCSMRRDRQTDRHDEGSSRFSQFCERARHNVRKPSARIINI
jgi:hypothetical protein